MKARQNSHRSARLQRSIRGSARIWAPALAVFHLAAFRAAPAIGEAARDPHTKTILFLNSYHQGYDWSDDIVRALKTSLQSQPFQTEMYVEYLDMKRFSGASHLASFKTFIATKYRARKPDLIVSSDDDALQFLLDNGAELFGNTPVVFCGVNDHGRAARAPRDRYTGVLEDFNTSAILDLALALHPGIHRVWVVSDDSPIGEQARNSYSAIAQQRKNLEFRFLDGSKMSIDEIAAAMGEIESRDLTILTAFARDKTGDFVDRNAAQRRLAQASAAPVFSPSISALGQGIVGANDNAGYEHGLRASRKAIAILNGTAPAAIPLEKHLAVQYVFDQDRLNYFDIPRERIPAGSRLINVRSTFYDQHRGLIWAVAAAITIETVIIALLLLNIRRRRSAERALLRQAGELSDANRSLVEANRAIQAEMSERRKAEALARSIQEQFWQAQKLEAVGRLAGGIAHDFNNLLTVIGGYGRLLLANPNSPDRERLTQIVKAGDRAAELTHQLLAFSRKKEVETSWVVLNDVILDTRQMIERIIGEDIELATDLSDGLRTVVADPGQVSQVLLNLAANARDAMPRGGRLRIATRNLTIPEGERLAPGSYVHLSVEDDGVGMDNATAQRVFEPFFTTKEVGRGTGLGLATVYGIVKQSGGDIQVTSEPGAGTCFDIFLPAVEAGRANQTPPDSPEVEDSGTGTVLVVEDQAEVRALTVTILESSGYKVLDASGAESALRMAAEYPGRIDLLVTDLVMPGMNGRDLADRMAVLRPDMRLLLMSGYAENVLGADYASPDIPFLAKPMRPEELRRKVGELLRPTHGLKHGLLT